MSDYPEPYLEYLIQFHAVRDYFECHELLEEYWKTIPAEVEGREVWVGLIQIAVAQYHHRRGNTAGALKMFEQSAERLKPSSLESLGLDGHAVMERVSERIAKLSSMGSKTPYVEFNLPFQDKSMLSYLQQVSGSRGLKWGAQTDAADDQLVHRHTLRDRSEVIAARKASAARKLQERKG
ncbi:DUF309 domain-containing protein [Paenibacillus sambharensis]|uniref:DUF309 domain-containing protein n=1 Tax=Paenibacillus sambharensis TaxID=1803190 RepID=A0A2W1L2Q8_9BACL|nr:DUF309 domain-containing protein [Paenibacillus sambharensis]PZD93626.1 DUF309 domain-containing protein [Paenibacillus sambharensis]